MKAVVKSVHSWDIEDFAAYRPDDAEDFNFLLELTVGPKDQEGAEIFNVRVCTPKWFCSRFDENDVILGRHYLIVFKYDFDLIMRKINSYIEDFCTGETWKEVAEKVSRLAAWEFEDYNPNR